MNTEQFRKDMMALMELCESMGLSPYKNGLRGPDDMDAVRKSVTRLYIVAENLHDVGRKAKDSNLLLSATKLRTLTEKLLKDLLVEGLGDLFALGEAPPGNLIVRQ